MKNISDYINEALETEKSRISGYRNIILTRRENIDCSNISEEDFCKFISEDIKLAAKIYDEEKEFTESNIKRYLDVFYIELFGECTKYKFKFDGKLFSLLKSA